MTAAGRHRERVTNWHVTRDPDTGVTRWTAPSGTTAVVEPAIVEPVVRYARALEPLTVRDDRRGRRPPPF